MWVCTVFRDESAGKFRMWYADGKDLQLYAESQDGITWIKPDLGLVSHAGSTKNNIVLANGYMIGIVRDPSGEKDSSGYTAMVWHTTPHVKQPGFYVYRSTDGLRWIGDLRRPVLTSTQNPDLWSSVGMGDTSVFRHDPMLGRYVVDAKFNLYLPVETFKAINKPVENGKNRIRTRTMLESEDLVHWTRPRYILFPDDRDEPDAQIYGHIAFNYESMWLGVVRVLHLQRTGWKQVELELSYSRDGRTWSRPATRRPLIPFGDPDSWEPDYSDVAMSGPLLVGDELWFYYRGSRSNARDKSASYKMSMGLATLRRDGFVSLNAGSQPGQVTTRPLTFTGRTLFVNADISNDGWVKAAVLSPEGQPVAQLSLEDAIPLTTGTVKGEMAWRSAGRLSPPGDGHVRIAFELKNAKMYSFWVE